MSNKLDMREVIVLRNYTEESWLLPRSHASVRFVWSEGDYGNYCVTSTGTSTHSTAICCGQYSFCWNRHSTFTFCIQSAETYENKNQLNGMNSLRIKHIYLLAFLNLLCFYVVFKVLTSILSSITLCKSEMRVDTIYCSG